MPSFKKFLEEQENKKPSFKKFLEKNKDSKVKGYDIDKYKEAYTAKAPDETTLPGIVVTLWDLIQRGQYASANLANELFDLFSGEDFEPISGVAKGIAGKEKGSYADVIDRIPRVTNEPEEYSTSLDYDYTKPIETIKEMFSDTIKEIPARTENFIRGIGGLAGDIFLDPLNYVGIGLLDETGKLASKLDDAVKLAKKTNKVEKLSDLDDPIKAILEVANIAEDSKVGKQIKETVDKYGIDILDLGETTAEQAVKGQRGLINFAGKPVIKGQKVFEGIDKVKDFVKNTAPGSELLSNFSTTYGVPDELVKMQKNYDRIEKLREYEVLNDKIKQFDDIVKDLDIPREELANIYEVKDLANKVDDVKVKEYVDMFKKDNKEILRLAKESGVPLEKFESDRLNYLAHVITPEARKKIVDKFKFKRDKTLLKDLLNKIQHGSTKGRNWNDMSIKEVNELARKGELPGFEDIKFDKFFEDDPVVIQAIRNLRSVKARTSAEFLQDIARKFGKREGENLVDVSKHIWNPDIKQMLEGYKFEPEVAEYLINYAQKMEPDNLSTFMRWFDNYQNFWKQTTLLPIPGFHVRNMLDNAWKNYLGDVNFNSYDDYIRLLTDGEIVTEAGKKITKDEFQKMAYEYGIEDTGFLLSNVGKPLEEQIRDMANPSKAKEVLNKINPLEIGRKVGGWNENTFRKVHFLDKLKKGYNPQQAADSVSKYLFDYSDLTKFEKDKMKRLMPFYTFTRKNIPLQLEMLVTQPGKMSKLPKTMDYIERFSEEPDESNLPEYIKESASVRVPDIFSGENPSYFLLDNWVSSADLLNVGSPSDALGTLQNMITPVAKVPFELYNNINTFTRQPIEDYPGELDDLFGYPIRGKAKHTITSLPFGRLLNEIDRLNPGNVFGNDEQRPYQDTEASRWLRALTGLKTYEYDPEASGYFNYLDNQDLYRQMLYDLQDASQRGDTKEVKKLEEMLKKFMEENTP